MNKDEINNWIEKGYLHTRIIIEIMGKPKEHIENTLQQYISKIKESKFIEIIHQEIAPSKEQEEGMWSTFAEMEFMIKGISRLVGFCFDYMPASVEILAPERIVFNHHTITDFVNDLQAKLHKMDMVLKNQNHENQFLKKNMQIIISNLICVSLSGKKLNKNQLSKITGIPEEGLNDYLDSLVQENKIKLESELYSIA